MDLGAEQPMPTPNDGPSVQSMVRADLEVRERIGRERYGTALQPHNGRDALRDAYEEAMDLTCYLRQEIEERPKWGAEPGSPESPYAQHLDRIADRDREQVRALITPGSLRFHLRYTYGLLPEQVNSMPLFGVCWHGLVCIQVNDADGPGWVHPAESSPALVRCGAPPVVAHTGIY